MKPTELDNVPFPECSNSCGAVKVLGVSECDSVCPHKEGDGTHRVIVSSEPDTVETLTERCSELRSYLYMASIWMKNLKWEVENSNADYGDKGLADLKADIAKIEKLLKKGK